MALAREHHTVPETALAPQVKNFLGRIPFGRLGLRIGAGIRPLLRKVRDPIQHKAWIRQFVLPLRNAVLLNRPLAVSFCEIPVFLAPQGSTAGNLWAGLCRERPARRTPGLRSGWPCPIEAYLPTARRT